LKKLCTTKEKVNEIVGVSLYWDHSEIGGDFLFWPRDMTHKNFSIDLHVNSPLIKMDDSYVITDFNWYWERLLPSLDKAFGVFSVSYEQTNR